MLGLEIFQFISEDAIWEKTSDKPITTKWVDVKKRSDGGGMVVRSWSAARGFPHQQLFAATPSVEAKKNLFRRDGSRESGEKKKRPGRTSKS